MSAGKTTLIKYLCHYLGAKDIAKSPSFAIINEYIIKNQQSSEDSGLSTTIFHFDFYRIKSESEAFDIGYEEYFFSGSYCFIEWPEKIINLMPAHYVRIDIEVNEDESRLITCSLIK